MLMLLCCWPAFSGEEHEPLSYEPVMDMQRFQRLLQEADREERQTGPTSSILQDLARKLADRGTQSSVSQTQATVAIPREVPRRNTTQRKCHVGCLVNSTFIVLNWFLTAMALGWYPLYVVPEGRYPHWTESSCRIKFFHQFLHNKEFIMWLIN